MDFYNKVLECETIVKDVSFYLNEYYEVLKSHWEGTASDKYFTNQIEYDNNLKILEKHFVKYKEVGNKLNQVLDISLEIAKIRNDKNEENDISVNNLLSRRDKLYTEINRILYEITLLKSTIVSSGNVNSSIFVDNQEKSSDTTKETKSINIDTSKVGQTIVQSANLTNTHNNKDNITSVELGDGDFMTASDWRNSPYVSKEDFRCKCGGKHCNGYPVEISKKLVEDLNNIRIKYDKPIIITSGIRCKQHNKNEGGASGSRHTMGKAADFYIPGVSSYEIDEYLKTLDNRRYSYTGSASGYSGMDGINHYDVY